MKYIKPLLIVLLLSGCSSSDNADEDKRIWRDDSERIVIVQDNGNVPNGESRYVTYDYTRDTLTIEAKNILPTISSVSKDLKCDQDATTYKITVTNGSGLEKVYHSNNKACNDTKGMVFVETSEISSLIPNLFNY